SLETRSKNRSCRYSDTREFQTRRAASCTESRLDRPRPASPTKSARRREQTAPPHRETIAALAARDLTADPMPTARLPIAFSNSSAASRPRDLSTAPIQIRRVASTQVPERAIQSIAHLSPRRREFQTHPTTPQATTSRRSDDEPSTTRQVRCCA